MLARPAHVKTVTEGMPKQLDPNQPGNLVIDTAIVVVVVEAAGPSLPEQLVQYEVSADEGKTYFPGMKIPNFGGAPAT